MTAPARSAAAPGPIATARFLGLRVLAVLAGIGCLGYGLVALLGGGRSTDLGSALPWLVGALVAHDAVLGPLGMVAAWVLARRFRRHPGVRVVLACCLFVAACLILLAVPALLSPGVPDNPTATPRDYSAGLFALLGVDAAVAVGASLAVVLAGRRTGRRAPTRSR